MARTIEFSVPPARTDQLVDAVSRVDGVLAVKLFRDASVDPPGDVISVEGTTDAALSVVRTVVNTGMDGMSLSTQALKGSISSGGARWLDREGNDAVWEEVMLYVRAESNVSANFLALMMLSGGIATVGLWTDTIHLVIGAMVLAPGFHPLLRIPLGYIAGQRIAAGRGYLAAASGYAAMAIGAAVSALVLTLVTSDPADALTNRHWVRYWSTVTSSGVFVSALAAAAGSFTTAADRGVLAAGAMIGLALVPAMAVTAAGLAIGDLALAGSGARRWLVDAALVIGVGALVLLVKQLSVHRRRAES